MEEERQLEKAVKASLGIYEPADDKEGDTPVKYVKGMDGRKRFAKAEDAI